MVRTFFLSRAAFFLPLLCCSQPVLAASDCLQAAVRVNEESSSCGTIIKVERDRVWVISTGHMEKRNSPIVEVFYRDDKKLTKPLKSKGKIVLRVENNVNFGIDFSLIEVGFGDFDHRRAFKQVSIGVAKADIDCISIGCDLAVDPTEFEVTVIEMCKGRGDLYTFGKNRTNGGRSGGGLFYKGKLVAVSWGVTVSGDEKGIFTSGQSIKQVLQACGYGRLLEADK